MLCKNYLEGFGTTSKYSSLPPTCFTDTILLPLPTFILLAAIPATILITSLACSQKPTQNSPESTFASGESGTPRWKFWRTRSSSNNGDGTPRKTKSYRAIAGIYYFLILANIMLTALEMGRLASDHMGVALLPFVTVGIALAGVLHFTRGFGNRVPCKIYRSLLLFFWLSNMVMEIIKTVGLSEEDKIDPRKEDMYPVEHQLTDTAVISALYFLIMLLEAGIWWVDGRRKRGLMASNDGRRGEAPGGVREGSLASGTTVAMEEGLGKGSGESR